MQEKITVEQANAQMLDTIEKLVGTEEIKLSEAMGRIVSEEQRSSINQPPFPRSPVDGYACYAKDTLGAKEKAITLKVIAEVDAGQNYEGTIKSGEAVRIMTGAPIPQGCTCCIRQEDTDYGEETVTIYHESTDYENYCHVGEDFQVGDVLLQANTKIGYIEWGILASMGKEMVKVFKQPKIAVFTTGDELVVPGTTLFPGKIYNSNQYLLVGRLLELKITPYIVKHLVDDETIVAKELQKVAKEVDLIITTGGVSVGKKDIFHTALPLAGAEKLFWKVQVKPGSPTIYSLLASTPIVSLSGNPFGALVNFEILVRPMLAKLTGDKNYQLVREEKILKNDFPKESRGRRIIRATYHGNEVSLPKKQASGILSSASGSNCLVDIPAGSGPLKRGDIVKIWKL